MMSWGVLFIQTSIWPKFVGIDLGTFFDASVDMTVQGFTNKIFNDRSFNFTSALQHSHDYSFPDRAVLLKSTANLFGLVHVPRFAADESFVNFNFTIQLAERFILQGKPDTMQHEPCGFLRYVYVACDFIAANSILAVSEHPSCGQPFIKTDWTIFHDGSKLDAELPLRVHGHALPETASREKVNLFTPTRRANHNTIGPALFGQIRKAVVRIAKKYDCLLECLRFGGIHV